MGDLGKLIAAKGFKKFIKVQSIAQSGHTAPRTNVLYKSAILTIDGSEYFDALPSSVWPDWAILKVLGYKFRYKSTPNIWQLSKPL